MGFLLVLGHIQRGGTPSCFDRVLDFEFDHEHQKHPFAKVAFSIILFNNMVTNLNKIVDLSNGKKKMLEQICNFMR